MGGWWNPIDGPDTAIFFNGGTGGATGVECSPSPAPTQQTSITPSMFRTFFANDVVMGAQTDDAIQMQIDNSVSQFNIPRWGDKYNLGQYYYIAHMIAFQRLTSTNPNAMYTDTLIMKKAGGVSAGRSATLIQQQVNNPLSRTIYGQEFMRLRTQVGVGAVSV